MKNFWKDFEIGSVLSCVVAAGLVLAAALAVSKAAANGIVYLIEGDASGQEPQVFVGTQFVQGYVGAEGTPLVAPQSGLLNLAQPALAGSLPILSTSDIPGKVSGR